MFALARETDGLNQRALLRMGWTRGMIARQLGAPDEVRPWRRGCCRHEYVYLRSRVDRAMGGVTFREAVERRERRNAAANVATWYPDWRAALEDACAGMFELNRFAKHAECLWRDEIYGWKDGLVELLYREGLCTACWEHLLVQPAKICWDCGGAGCGRCDGTGEYLPARTLRFFAFRFTVGARTFCWHQPEHLVRFEAQTTEPAAEWSGAEEKPVRMTRRQLAAALELVRWVVESAKAKAVAA